MRRPSRITRCPRRQQRKRIRLAASEPEKLNDVREHTMSDESMATFGNTTKGGHRAHSYQKGKCPNAECGVHITRLPCWHCGYPQHHQRGEPMEDWTKLLWKDVDGEIILHQARQCDRCERPVERFRHKMYAEQFFRVSPQLCQRCQDGTTDRIVDKL
jgi:hypothetical protein